MLLTHRHPLEEGSALRDMDEEVAGTLSRQNQEGTYTSRSIGLSEGAGETGNVYDARWIMLF